MNIYNSSPKQETCKTTTISGLPQDENVYENKFEQKSESRNPKKSLHFYNIIMLVLILIAIGGCYGLVGKLMLDNLHEKEVQEKTWNLSKAETLKYMKQLQQFNTQQKQINKNVETYYQAIEQLKEFNTQQKQINKNSETHNRTIEQIKQFNNEQKQINDNVEKQLSQNSDSIDKINGSIQGYKTKGYTTLNDGWIAPFNGYKYQVFNERLNWTASRLSCQSYGGDLASIGIQSLHTRRSLSRFIYPKKFIYHVWIGLNDISNEGTWRWLSSSGSLDGDYATNDMSLWYQSSPTTSSNDCAVLDIRSAYAFTLPFLCSNNRPFLCEKKL